MPLQIKQNLPLLVTKQATITSLGLPDIETISANIIKKADESTSELHTQPTFPNAKPPSSFAPPVGSGSTFVELPTVDASKLPPPPMFGMNQTTQTTLATPKNEKPQYTCNAVLEAPQLPPEWSAKEGQEIAAIKIRTVSGERTLGQAIFWFDPRSATLLISAQTFQ